MKCGTKLVAQRMTDPNRASCYQQLANRGCTVLGAIRA